MICAAYNPMKDLISIASQSPLLLNSMLSVAARHRYETFNTEIVPMGKSTFDSKKIFISALQYRSRAIRLMRNHFLETSSANIVDVVDETSAPLEQVRKRELWESPQLLVALLLFMYFEIIDGGQGDGSWRKHLEVAKWGVYHRENRGLQLGMGHYWDFMREHFEM